MTNTPQSDTFLDLEIYIAPRRDMHYPVRVRLGEEQEFDGALDAEYLLHLADSHSSSATRPSLWVLSAPFTALTNGPRGRTSLAPGTHSRCILLVHDGCAQEFAKRSNFRPKWFSCAFISPMLYPGASEKHR